MNDCGNCAQLVDNLPLLAGYLLIYWLLQGGDHVDLISKQLAIDAPFKKFDMRTGVTWIPIEYIEQLPPCEDTISRQAAIDAFMSATSDGDKAEWCKWVLERV